MKQQLYAFDIDGTIFKGPPSFFSLLRFSLLQKRTYSNSSQIDPNPIPLLAKKIDELDDYGVFPAYFIQTPKPQIQTLIANLSASPNSKLVIVSGRGKKLLSKITIAQLKKFNLLHFFSEIYLKPKNYKSSLSWKFHCLKSFCQQYSSVCLIENDLITSLKIASFAQKEKLPIKIILIKSLETNPLVFRLLQISPLSLSQNHISLY